MLAAAQLLTTAAGALHLNLGQDGAGLHATPRSIAVGNKTSRLQGAAVGWFAVQLAYATFLQALWLDLGRYGRCLWCSVLIVLTVLC